jgi:hypothetical protein
MADLNDFPDAPGDVSSNKTFTWWGSWINGYAGILIEGVSQHRRPDPNMASAAEIVGTAQPHTVTFSKQRSVIDVS